MKYKSEGNVYQFPQQIRRNPKLMVQEATAFLNASEVLQKRARDLLAQAEEWRPKQQNDVPKGAVMAVLDNREVF